jgi:hypothetical protein
LAFCSTIRTVMRCSRAIVSRMRKSSRREDRAPGPADGSSSSSSRGRIISARATASICCSPPLRLPGLLTDALAQAREPVAAALHVLVHAAVAAGVGADAQVVGDRQVGERAAPLGHVADAGPGDRVGRAADELLAGEADAAAGVAPSPRSRAARSSCRPPLAPEDGDDPPLGDVDVDPVEDQPWP